MTNDIGETLVRLASQTVSELWRAARHEPNVAMVNVPSYAPGRAKTLRLSEQESRFLFARLAADAGHWISVETPTETPHNFTGLPSSPGRSAQHDLSLHEGPGSAALAHVEFKHGGMKGVNKDLHKLIRSAKPSLIFHTYETKRVSLGTLLAGYLQGLGDVLSQHADPAKAVVLVFCHPLERQAWLAHVDGWSALSAALAAGIGGTRWRSLGDAIRG